MDGTARIEPVLLDAIIASMEAPARKDVGIAAGKLDVHAAGEHVLMLQVAQPERAAGGFHARTTTPPIEWAGRGAAPPRSPLAQPGPAALVLLQAASGVLDLEVDSGVIEDADAPAGATPLRVIGGATGVKSLDPFFAAAARLRIRYAPRRAGPGSGVLEDATDAVSGAGWRRRTQRHQGQGGQRPGDAAGGGCTGVSVRGKVRWQARAGEHGVAGWPVPVQHPPEHTGRPRSHRRALVHGQGRVQPAHATRDACDVRCRAS